MNGIQLQFDSDGLLTPVIENGSMAVGDVKNQNTALILSLHKGELKENPAVGVGISDMLLDNDPLFWRSAIREQLEMDGQQVTSIRITTSSIDIDSSY
jgi:hypothetical protein